jgi:hypothetical protein
MNDRAALVGRLKDWPRGPLRKNTVSYAPAWGLSLRRWSDGEGGLM